MFDKFVRIADLDKRKKLQCNDCKRQTIHYLEAQCRGNWSEAHSLGEIYGYTDFSLYRCGACDEVCFEKSTFFSEIFDHDEDGNSFLIPTEEQYPPPSSADFAFDTSFTPAKLDELIEEMLYALAGGKLNLATVALRMVIEYIVHDAKCAGRNLHTQLQNLFKNGHVDEVQHELLQKIREKGNDGAHRRKAMTRNEMVAGIGVVNLLLEKFYNGPARQDEIVKKANQAFQEPRKDKVATNSSSS